MKNCKIHDNYSCGIAACGGKHWTLDGLIFENNGVRDPACHVDYEDGWESAIGDVWRNCSFDNERGGGIILVSGNSATFYNNEIKCKFDPRVRSENWRVYHNIISKSVKVVKTIVTEEEATFKSGILTWNGKTLAQLCSTARVTESEGIRTVKIGGIGNHDGKSYAICFHHEDKIDGDVWIVIRGVNQGGFSLAFAKDKETVIDAEFKCLPQDEEGTLIQYVEKMSTNTMG